MVNWDQNEHDKDTDQLTCPECGILTGDGEYCGECLSERASYYTPTQAECDEETYHQDQRDMRARGYDSEEIDRDY